MFANPSGEKAPTELYETQKIPLCGAAGDRQILTVHQPLAHSIFDSVKATAAPLSARIQESVRHIRSKTGFEPEVGIILGSGLGGLAEHVQPAAVLPYPELPGFHPV